MRLYLSHLVVPLGQRVQVGQVAPVSRWWGIRVGHDFRVYQVYQAHLVRDGQGSHCGLSMQIDDISAIESICAGKQVTQGNENTSYIQE